MVVLRIYLNHLNLIYSALVWLFSALFAYASSLLFFYRRDLLLGLLVALIQLQLWCSLIVLCGELVLSITQVRGILCLVFGMPINGAWVGEVLGILFVGASSLFVNLVVFGHWTSPTVVNICLLVAFFFTLFHAYRLRRVEFVNICVLYVPIVFILAAWRFSWFGKEFIILEAFDHDLFETFTDDQILR